MQNLAKLLGRATHAANNHKVQEVREDGKVVTRIVRDAVNAPRKVSAAAGRDVSRGPRATPAHAKPLPAVKP